MKTIIQDVRFLQRGTMCFGDLHIEDGYVERIDYKTPKPYSDLAINGFVDIHTHGFRGIACENKDPNALRELANAYAKRGTVAFAATLDPLPFCEYEEIFAAYREAFQGNYSGAIWCGMHLEGPYLNPQKAYALHPEHVKAIDLQELEQFLKRNSDIIRVMSLAPELENGMEAIRLLQRYGVKPSLAHTLADYDTTTQAIENGMHQVTHLCNAMPEFNHHRAQALDAIIASDCMCELNMDGVHIQKPMLQWLISLLGADRIMAISDGTAFSGFEYPDGYALNEYCIAKNNAIYRQGRLYSSFQDLLDAFRFLHCECELPLEDCLKMTSLNAGKLLHTLNYEIGLGKKADLALLDHNMELKNVIINGKNSL